MRIASIALSLSLLAAAPVAAQTGPSLSKDEITALEGLLDLACRHSPQPVVVCGQAVAMLSMKVRAMSATLSAPPPKPAPEKAPEKAPETPAAPAPSP